jgi:hypothetical protein
MDSNLRAYDHDQVLNFSNFQVSPSSQPASADIANASNTVNLKANESRLANETAERAHNASVAANRTRDSLQAEVDELNKLIAETNNSKSGLQSLAEVKVEHHLHGKSMQVHAVAVEDR